MTEEMIEACLEHHFEPRSDDGFRTESDWLQDASFSRCLSGLSVR